MTQILRKLRCRTSVLIICFIFILLLLPKLAFNSRRRDIQQPPPQIDSRTETCYDYIQSLTNNTTHENGTSQTASSSSRSKLVKRDHQLLTNFGCLVNEGERYLDEALVNPIGRFTYPPREFGPHALYNNGWSSSTSLESLPNDWDEILPHIDGGTPLTEPFARIGLRQEGRFDNDYHRRLPPTHAQYTGYYSTDHPLILMTDTFSPLFRAWIHDRTIAPHHYLPYVPHLNYLSDAVWHIWTQISRNPSSLRYFAIDGINAFPTSQLIDYLLRRDRPGESPVSWDRRLTFGLDTDEGKALLATPNGIAVLWLLVHRRGVLGPRDPRVTIWDEERSRRMVWELIPVGRRSSFDDYEGVDFGRGV
ncbi:MAG: hypothetical protein Q9168_006480 [Polycauliona sp. 1 TL-2023]